MTEFNPSLAPRIQMKRSFLPFNPMVPSARARFSTKGISTSVDIATARPVLNDWLRNERRVMMLICCIGLLFLGALQGHDHCHHSAHARVIGGTRRGKC